jgi:DNA-binding CsgD family transcriptional regulator
MPLCVVADPGLLVEESASNDVFYRAAHPLISEVAYAELSDSRRRRLHAEVAAALEAVGVEDPQRLAHHYRGAAWEVDANRALQVLMAAATAAEHMHADAEASAYLTAALDLARIDHPALVAELLERLGSARMRAGQIELAVAAWTEAAREQQRDGDWSGLIRLRGLLATADWERGRFSEAEEQLAAALDTGRRHAANSELVELRYIQLQLRARQADAAGLEEVLSALAEAGGTPELTAATNLTRGYAAFLEGRFGDARDLVLVAAEMAEKAGLLAMAARAQRQLATIAANAGDAKLCRDHLAADLALVARAGSPMLEVGARAMIVATDLINDAWEESLTSSRRLMVLSKRIGSPRGLATSLAVQAIVHAYRGEIVAARRSVAEARQVYGDAAAVDRHIFIFVEISEAITALAGGKAEQARRFAAAAVAAPDVLPVLAYMVMGEAEVAANDPEAALGAANHLRNLGPKAPWPVACASWVDGLARAALGQRLSALACLLDAADRLEGLDLPYQEAKARLRWAEVAVGDLRRDADASQARSEAAAEARRALINFDRLGARPAADRARRLLRDLGERVMPPHRVVTGDLSDRELQVVRLVAAGLSNNEIADRLYISPRTVTTHLQHVYQRLGLASRTALVRWALDRGLASDNT